VKESSDEPKYPKMAAQSDRFETFECWGLEKDQKPAFLAKAGFFSVNNLDCVTCFHCGGGLENWTNANDPFIEHAKYFPHCKFIREEKGENFIASARRLLKPFRTMSANESMFIQKYDKNMECVQMPMEKFYFERDYVMNEMFI